jgi:hypothetical protein
MLLTIMKIIIFIYPFLRELLIGKYSENKEFRNFKIFFIIVAISSLVANIYLVKSSYTLSKEKIEFIKKISELEQQLKQEKNKPVQQIVIPSTPSHVPEKQKQKTRDNNLVYRKELEVDHELSRKLRSLNEMN